MAETNDTPQQLEELDSITRAIDIDASQAWLWAQGVSAGVVRQGGAVYTEPELGTAVSYRTETEAEGWQVDVVHLPGQGDFRLRTVELSSAATRAPIAVRGRSR